MQFFVASNIESRRTTYFIKAGKSLGADARFITYEELLQCLPRMQQAVVKLEPFVYEEAGFEAYTQLCATDREVWKRLGETEKADSVFFLNAPWAILQALDKVACKEALRADGLRVTPLISTDIPTFDVFADRVACCPRGVFLKPRYGSGAGGILAVRYRPGRKQWVAYTTLVRNESRIYNSKRIRRLTDAREIAVLVETVLKGGALAEEWVAKDSIRGENYDLRVVCRGDQVDYIVVRYSNGAITNLHLNNKAGRFDDLELPVALKEEICSMSIAATQTLGLYYAGVDVLLEKGSRTPYIIEVNGQGDHIYQDLFDENRIYTRQIESFLTTEKDR